MVKNLSIKKFLNRSHQSTVKVEKSNLKLSCPDFSEAKLAPPTESLPLEELRLDAAFSSMTAPGNEQTC